MWDGIEIPMKSRDATLEDSYFIHDSPCLVEAAERIKRILDVKYEPADLEEVVANCTHLSEEEKEGLHSLLKKIYISLFDGSLEPEKVRITISNYAVILHCIMLVLFQFHGSMSKPYDTKSIGYTK